MPTGEEQASPTWKVAELAAHLSRLMAGAFPDDLWVEGQIRNLSRAPNGHVYFQLTDPVAAGAAPTSQLGVVLLQAERRHVNELLMRAGGAVRMDDGIEVRIAGRLRWWSPRGTVQLRMTSIDPEFTLGRLTADRDRTLAALAAAGLLTANAALPFPAVPLRVGLVTSDGSAAHADFLAELGASGYAFTVRLADARTQGAGSEPSIVAALERLAREPLDVVALVRGGGARTDLVAFDTERVARAIAAMAVPVLTGIGHEIDRSIADEVAHTSFKTPTAVAAALVDRVRAFLTGVDDLWAATARVAVQRLDGAEALVAERSRRVARSADRALAHHAAVIDAAPGRLGRGTTRGLDRQSARLEALTERVLAGAGRWLDRSERDVVALDLRLRAHDVDRALRRGWSITRDAAGRVVRSVDQVPAGATMQTQVADGILTSQVVGGRTSVAPPEHVPDPPVPPTEEPTP
ncbi:MAG: xseA [Acidimicrobiales bacterium]|nr:xseA [Acidimicrobiales bacterium]